jgi:type I restriction enzyme, S subunit
MIKIVEFLKLHSNVDVNHAKISTFASEKKERNLNNNEYEVISVRNTGELVKPSSLFEHEISSDNKYNYKVIRPGEFVYNPSRINIGSIAWNKSDDVLITSPMYVVFEIDEVKVKQEYLMLFLNSSFGKSKIDSIVTMGARFRCPFDILSEIRIPLPSLPVQEEIVRILDEFTELEAVLEAELEARTKQYEYYSSTLLDFSTGKVGFPKIDQLLQKYCLDGLEPLFLSDICEYSNVRISSNLLSVDNYVGVDNLLQNRAGRTISSFLPTKGSFSLYNPGDILIGNIRPYLRKIWFSDRQGGANGDVLVIKIRESHQSSLLTKFLYYQLSSDKFFEFNNQNSKGAKMPRGDKKKIMQYVLFVPPKIIQQEIVRILDEFSEYTTSLTKGLPAEIDLRKKQYEYYRNQLLTF